jgi:DNA repair photolyase
MILQKTILEPVIVSASRETDLPRFYADWFVERLREGWCEWKNPFNGEMRKVSFDKTRMIVFWSKNPRPMLERLDEVESFGFRQYYFQFTLNDYVNEGLEPNVPCVEERIDTFRRIADRIGRERVIWRFDPLLLTDKISIDVLLERIAKIGRQLKGYTEKLVFSFIDIASYRKVQKNLAGYGVREFSADEQVQFAKGLAELNKDLGLELATCGESVGLSEYGIKHNKCVDDELMMRLFNDDAKLMEFIGAEYDMFNGWQIMKSKKDKGQRKACGCIVSKDIGAYNTCPHLCRYCYANSHDSIVMSNWKSHCENPSPPLIIS